MAKTIFYEATVKIDSDWIYRNSVSHDFMFGKGEVVLDDSVTKIGEKAFFKCTDLTSITFPDSVTEIGKFAFRNCKNLISLVIPDSVEIIGDYAFLGCNSLKSIVVDKNNPKYDSRDNCNAIIETETNRLIQGCQNTIIPDSVEIIGAYAFRGCTCLASIKIPNSVTKIGEEAFFGCDNLKLSTITMPDHDVEIGKNAFFSDDSYRIIHYRADCPLSNKWIKNNSLSHDFADGEGEILLKLNGLITKIGEKAFQGSYMVEIEIPKSVTEIGKMAFSDCQWLTYITIPYSVTKIGEKAFCNCYELESIEIPDSVTEIGESAFRGWSNLSEEDRRLLQKKYNYNDF